MINYFQKNPITEALKKEARRRGTPLYGAFELTSRCNFNCAMCYVHTMDNYTAMKSELTTEQWKSIMDTAHERGMLFALFTGGECLLRQDFKDLYLHVYNKGVLMSVNTNGSLLNDDYISFFISHRPERIQISLYGSDDSHYKTATGVSAFSQVTHAIDELRKNNIFVEVAITANPMMKNDYATILRYVKQNNIDYSTSTYLIPTRDGDDDFTFSFEDQLFYTKVKNEVLEKKIASHGKIPPESGSPCEEHKYGMPCNAGTIRFVVTSNGTMIPCMSIPEINISVLDNSFDDCWSYIHGEMKKVLQASECHDCFYKKYCPFCPAIRWKDFSSGHCREELCELQKRKYNLGMI